MDRPDTLPVMSVSSLEELTARIPVDELVNFLHREMDPYHDEPVDIRKGLDYALSREPNKGGRIFLAFPDGCLAGALVLLYSGMEGYIPSNIILFVAVASSFRRRGIGSRLMEAALAACNGPVKLHVEPDNPARRLYEKLGFTAPYIEMRRP